MVWGFGGFGFIVEATCWGYVLEITSHFVLIIAEKRPPPVEKFMPQEAGLRYITVFKEFV